MGVYRDIIQHKHTNNLDDIREELLTGLQTEDVQKDIIIVVKDQLSYLKPCIESIYQNTNKFTIYIWDNASGPETKEYLNSILSFGNVVLRTSEQNLGFASPNNRLAELTTSDYIILLNSDTEVRPNWDRVMIGWLKNYPKTKLVGYGGALLNEQCKGGIVGFGYEIDYVSGWAVAMSRETYNQFGVFDETNLHFAYCEDADLSLRVKEAGFDVYSLYADLVTHFENKAMKEVNKDDDFRKWFQNIFEQNHAYMRKRWLGKQLLLHERKIT